MFDTTSLVGTYVKGPTHTRTKRPSVLLGKPTTTLTGPVYTILELGPTRFFLPRFKGNGFIAHEGNQSGGSHYPTVFDF